MEYSNDLKMYFPTSALDDMLMPLIDEFQNESLWDELVRRLAKEGNRLRVAAAGRYALRTGRSPTIETKGWPESFCLGPSALRP